MCIVGERIAHYHINVSKVQKYKRTKVQKNKTIENIVSLHSCTGCVQSSSCDENNLLLGAINCYYNCAPRSAVEFKEQKGRSRLGLRGWRGSCHKRTEQRHPHRPHQSTSLLNIVIIGRVLFISHFFDDKNYKSNCVIIGLELNEDVCHHDS